MSAKEGSSGLNGSKQPPSEPRVKAAKPAGSSFKDEQRAAERVALRRKRDFGPEHDCSLGELLQRLFDEDGHRHPDLADSAALQVADDLLTLSIAIEMGRDSLDTNAIALRLSTLRTRLVVAVELARRDRVANSGTEDEAEVAS